MWRFILFAGVFIAIASVLWSSWRLDRRLFIGVATGLALFALIFGFGAWQGSQQALVPVANAQLNFTLNNFRALETGTRLTGVLHNKGTEPVAVITLDVVQQRCNEQQCDDVARTELVLRRHINAESSADINEIIRLKSPSLTAPSHYQWHIEISDVQGYRRPKGVSGL